MYFRCIDTTCWLSACWEEGVISKSTFLRAYGALTFFSARLRRADKSIVTALGLRPSIGSVRRNPVRANIEIGRIEARATTNHISRCERP